MLIRHSLYRLEAWDVKTHISMIISFTSSSITMTIIKKIYLLAAILLTTNPYIFAQSAEYDLTYQVVQRHDERSLTRDQLSTAKTLSDLNPHYEASWIAEYLDVEISAMHNGEWMTAHGTNIDLNRDQKTVMLEADDRSPIIVEVRYIPNNTLSVKEERILDFRFFIEPDQRAQFPGGQEALQTYLEEHRLQDITAATIAQHQLAAVKFTIDSSGKIIDVHLAHPSNDKHVDETLIKTVCDMPDWTPASYKSGQQASQDYVLMVGDTNSCVINLLHVRS